MGDRVDPCCPPERQAGVDQLPRVQDRGRGIAEQRNSAVLLGLPERPAASRPLLLDAPLERVIERSRIAEGNLPAPHQHRAEDHRRQGDQATEDRRRQEPSIHCERNPSRGSVKRKGLTARMIPGAVEPVAIDHRQHRPFQRNSIKNLPQNKPPQAMPCRPPGASGFGRRCDPMEIAKEFKAERSSLYASTEIVFE